MDRETEVVQLRQELGELHWQPGLTEKGKRLRRRVGPWIADEEGS